MSCFIATAGNLPITIQPNVLWPFAYVMGRRESISIKNFQYNRHSLASSVYYRAFYGWARRKKFKNKGSQIAGKRYIDKRSCNCIANNPFNCTFFKLMYKRNVTNSSKILDFSNAMTQLGVSQALKVGGSTPLHILVATSLMSTTIDFRLASP